MKAKIMVSLRKTSLLICAENSFSKKFQKLSIFPLKDPIDALKMW